jgi:hypothetical protein
MEFDDKCIEDFYVCFDTNSLGSSSSSWPSMFMGRIPCKTQQEAAQVVDKIIQTENTAKTEELDVADFSNWRNRVLLACDDDMQGSTIDRLGDMHLRSTELLGNTINTNSPATDIRRVYLYDYQWNIQGEKPEAASALISGFNNGVSIVNFFGHGADNVWADERLLVPENINNMTNVGKYPLVGSFSCGVGKFDKPGSIRCLSEYLLIANKRGSVASVSSTREAYADANENLALNFFRNLYGPDSCASSFGQAFFEAKITVADDNQKTYCYMGDPSVALPRPKRSIALSVLSDNGISIDTIKALQRITIQGIVSNYTNTVIPDINYGSQNSPVPVQIGIFNPPYIASRKDGGKTPRSYTMQGSQIFSCKGSIINGKFSLNALIPKNVSFNKDGAKILAYANTVNDICIGVKNNIVFSGYSDAVISDTTGPRISIRPVYKNSSSATPSPSFTDKLSVLLPFSLEICVFDSNGVDAVSTGPDEGITFEITGPKNQERTNLDQQFIQGSDYHRGTALIGFDQGKWPEGSYKLLISAQDLLGNITHSTFSMDITNEKELTLSHVFNYPNPMRMGQKCKFYFDISKVQATDVRIIIKIYTMSGRLIRVINDAKRGVEFDGRDNLGNVLSPGVYLYQLFAADPQTLVKSNIEKLAINPPQ